MVNTLYGRHLFKPALGVQIDWGHPLARGLVAAFLTNEGGGPVYDVVRNVGASLNSGDTWGSNEAGRAIKFNGATTKILCGTGYGARFSNDISVFAIASVTGTNGGVIELTGTGDSINKAWLLFVEGSSWKFRAVDTLTRTAVGGSTGGVQRVGGTCGPKSYGGNPRVFVNGVKSVSADVFAGPFNDTTGNLIIGSLGGDIYPLTGATNLLYVWNRALSDEEMTWLYMEPYAFLLQPTHRRWFVPSAPAGAFETILLEASAGGLLREDGGSLLLESSTLTRPVIPYDRAPAISPILAQ